MILKVLVDFSQTLTPLEVVNQNLTWTKKTSFVQKRKQRRQN